MGETRPRRRYPQGIRNLKNGVIGEVCRVLVARVCQNCAVVDGGGVCHFDFLKGPDINQGVKEYSTTDGAVLLDVRTPDEYRQGHIPGSKNVPLQSIDKVAGMIDNKATPIFVHCLSGARSRQAAAVLQQLGYTNVKNIGGISAYAGKVER